MYRYEKITLDKIIEVLKTGVNRAEVPKDLAAPAKATLTRMLELAR